MTAPTSAAHERRLAKIYRDVPAAELEAFQRFRREHPPRTAQIGGRSWSFLTGGSGEDGRTLLFLPGAQGTGEAVWTSFDYFEKRYRCLAPNYPPVETMTELADGLAALLDQEGIARAVVIGGSYGGFVAQVFVRRHPDRVERLILSHTGPPVPRRGEVIAKSLRWLPKLPMFLLRLQYRKVMSGVLPPGRPELALVRAYLEEIIAFHLTKEGMINGYRRVVDYDRTRFAPEDLAGWPGRVLLLMGDNDPATPPPIRERMKALYPGAEVRIFEGSGHAAGILKRDEYVAAMEAFLEPSPPE
jgi:pimeloyl-ACP methyl ester carboxylesterase